MLIMRVQINVAADNGGSGKPCCSPSTSTLLELFPAKHKCQELSVNFCSPIRKWENSKPKKLFQFWQVSEKTKIFRLIITRNKVEVFTNHVAFQVLKVKPGTVPISHFLPKYDHVVWVPTHKSTSVPELISST
ncbi:hypothetical protein Prudu_004040 [Prunus dulcis]|uniref:BURP domain-containing protein n=1 Tax=Prunus dulcis TaxID=3755 RepID=A0A4Y1QUE3_PRUDU|nr:hypothetical protein Prudu_004040 [Prunus dulcis]